MAKCKECGKESDMIFGDECLSCMETKGHEAARNEDPVLPHWQDDSNWESGPGDSF